MKKTNNDQIYFPKGYHPSLYPTDGRYSPLDPVINLILNYGGYGDLITQIVEHYLEHQKLIHFNQLRTWIHHDLQARVLYLWSEIHSKSKSKNPLNATKHLIEKSTHFILASLENCILKTKHLPFQETVTQEISYLTHKIPNSKKYNHAQLTKKTTKLAYILVDFLFDITQSNLKHKLVKLGESFDYDPNQEKIDSASSRMSATEQAMTLAPYIMSLKGLDKISFKFFYLYKVYNVSMKKIAEEHLTTVSKVEYYIDKAKTAINQAFPNQTIY